MTREVGESIVIHEGAVVKKYRGDHATGKPYEEILDGDSLHRDSQSWRNRRRIIDRANDAYHEVITDQDGTAVHECHEPLSEHQGHGSARKG